MLKCICIFLLLITLNTSGCTFNDQNSNNEVDLQYLDFLKNAELVTVLTENPKTSVSNPYILADSQDEIDNITSIICNTKGTEIMEINTSELSKKIYSIEFEDIPDDNTKRINYVFLYDYDNSYLYVNSSRNISNKFNNDTKKPKYVAIKINNKFKKIIDNAIQESKPRFSQSELKERDSKIKMLQPK